MDSFDDDEYRNYWETNMFFQSQELDSYFNEANSAYYSSSSPEGTHNSSKNIISERSRRRKLNERLYALRSVVPNISKMDKASIIKDAIKYIQSLNDERRRIQSEISQLESVTAGISVSSSNTSNSDDLDQVAPTFCSNPERTNLENCYDSAGSRLMSSPLEVLELRVSNMGENTAVVTLTCSKKRDTVVKLCEIFQSLNLQIITATITALPGRILKTVFLECDGEKNDVLRLKIEAAIAALNDPDSPLSTKTTNK